MAKKRLRKTARRTSSQGCGHKCKWQGENHIFFRPSWCELAGAVKSENLISETATDIANHLGVSKRTVESHLVNVYRKLGVSSKTELIRRAAEFGI